MSRAAYLARNAGYEQKHGEYPKTLVHPSYAKGVPRAITGSDTVSGKKFTDYTAPPDRYPPVTVTTPDQEDQYRAKGYHMKGETEGRIEHREYPVCLTHPDYAEAVQQTETMRGKPEKFPPQIASNEDEELVLLEKGYTRPGVSDPGAIEVAGATPYAPGQILKEYPRWENGVLVDPDAKTSDFEEYPKYIDAANGENLVKNAAEEKAYWAKHPDRAVAANPAQQLERLPPISDEISDLVSGRHRNKGGRPRKVQPEAAAAE